MFNICYNLLLKLVYKYLVIIHKEYQSCDISLGKVKTYQKKAKLISSKVIFSNEMKITILQKVSQWQITGTTTTIGLTHNGTPYIQTLMRLD